MYLKKELSVNRKSKSFVSILLILGSLFALVFFKMEVRRLGYEVWQLSRVEKNETEKVRAKNLAFAKLVRPERVEKYAKTYWALQRANQNQVIQLQTAGIHF